MFKFVYSHVSMVHALTDRFGHWYETLHSWLQNDIKNHCKRGTHSYPLHFGAVCTHHLPLPAMPLWYDALYVIHNLMLHPSALKQWMTQNTKTILCWKNSLFRHHCPCHDTYIKGLGMCSIGWNIFYFGQPHLKHIHSNNQVTVHQRFP